MTNPTLQSVPSIVSRQSAKIDKSNKSLSDYQTAIAYLRPDRILCQDASEGCFFSCLNTAGRGVMNSVQKSRMMKSKFYHTNPVAFHKQEVKEIKTFVKYCLKKGKLPAYRPDGTSGTLRGAMLSQLFPDVTIYDYCKNLAMFMLVMADRIKYDNYFLTFSYSGDNWLDCLKALTVGNVAVVFEKYLPETYMGHKVISGEKSDERYLDNCTGCIVGLTAKGKAKKDTSGFVIKQAV